jgi:hypothetical protein
MMAFITRSSVKPEPARWLVWLALAISLWLVALPSRAEGINPRLASLALQDGYLVANTRFAIQLNPTLSDALDEGVPLAFRLQFRLNRPRLFAWWQQLSGGFEPTAEQQYKLSFHSLTQTWRVSVGGALYKSYPTLNDALAAIGAIRGWRVLGKAAVGKSRLSEFAGEVRLSLDISQLPRPFQLSALGATDWKLESDWTPMALEGEH